EIAGVADEFPGVAKRSAEPRRQAGRQCGQSPDASAVVRLVESLDRRHFDVVAPVRGKGQHAEGVAKRAHGLGENRDRKALDVENGGPGCETVAGRFRNVEQQQNREIAMLRSGGTENARIWLLTHPQRDSRLEHRVDVKIVAVKLSLQ